jgi:hypothetical protein
MHDLVKHFEKEETMHDFEGFADPAPILKKCKIQKTKQIWNGTEFITEETRQVYVWDFWPHYGGDPTPEDLRRRELERSIFLSFLYTGADSCGKEYLDQLTENNIIDLWELTQHILSCRWWSKVTDEMIQELEHPQPPEEAEEGEN